MGLRIAPKRKLFEGGDLRVRRKHSSGQLPKTRGTNGIAAKSVAEGEENL
jgi:hypothetical protein